MANAFSLSCLLALILCSETVRGFYVKISNQQVSCFELEADKGKAYTLQYIVSGVNELNLKVTIFDETLKTKLSTIENQKDFQYQFEASDKVVPYRVCFSNEHLDELLEVDFDFFEQRDDKKKYLKQGNYSPQNHAL